MFTGLLFFMSWFDCCLNTTHLVDRKSFDRGSNIVVRNINVDKGIQNTDLQRCRFLPRVDYVLLYMEGGRRSKSLYVRNYEKIFNRFYCWNL